MKTVIDADKKESIGSAIRRLRETRGMTLAEVSRSIGVSRAAVNSWETARTVPTAEKVWCLADFFGVSVAEVLGKTETVEKTVEKIPSTEGPARP